MEYYKKIKELLGMEELAKMRLEQLEREEKIDKLLKKCNNDCPEQVTRFLFNMRELNRYHAKKVHGLSILDYPNQMMKAYNDIRSVQKHFWWEHLVVPEPYCNSFHYWDHSDENMRDPNNVCQSFLPELNDKLEKGLYWCGRNERGNGPIIE
uniref:Uncharacterized protein n=1 Tax=viral metagenome TaxID=1070528 RepID=A0A6C0EJR1_9ZZZZ